MESEAVKGIAVVAKVTGEAEKVRLINKMLYSFDRNIVVHACQWFSILVSPKL
jgi:hypothetical protein